MRKKYIVLTLSVLLAIVLLLVVFSCQNSRPYNYNVYAIPLKYKPQDCDDPTSHLKNFPNELMCYITSYYISKRGEATRIVTPGSRREAYLATCNWGKITSKIPFYQKLENNTKPGLAVFDGNEYPLKSIDAKDPKDLQKQLMQIYEGEDYVCVFDKQNVSHALCISFLIKDNSENTIYTRIFYSDFPEATAKDIVFDNVGVYANYKDCTIFILDSRLNYEVWSPDNGDYKLISRKKLNTGDDPYTNVGLNIIKRIIEVDP